MPKYRLDPPISGIFVPEVGAFNADADGIFEMPAVAAVEKALAVMGVTATEVVPEEPAAPPDGGEGGTSVDGAEAGADSLAGALTVEGADSLAGATTVEGADTIAGAADTLAGADSLAGATTVAGATAKPKPPAKSKAGA